MSTRRVSCIGSYVQNTCTYSIIHTIHIDPYYYYMSVIKVLIMMWCVGVAGTKGDDDLLDDWLNDLNSITSSNSQQVSGYVVNVCVCTLHQLL